MSQDDSIYKRLRIQDKECPKIREAPPCVDATKPNTVEDTPHNYPNLCQTFKTVFAENNLRYILEIMKFSHSSPLPQTLEGMADYGWKKDNYFQVLFPNNGELSFLQKHE